MDSKALYASFNEVDDDILERSERASFSNVIPNHRRFLVVLIAAILALFLMGAGLMVSKYGDSIQSWFTYYWKEITGQDISDPHASVIDRLSQKIDLSETVEGVTVTVDSATVGEGSIVILLRVEGLAFSKKDEYGFDEAQITLAPDTAEDILGLFYTSSYNFWCLDADGAALFLTYCDYSVKDEPQTEKPPYTVTLSMTNFSQNPKTDNRMLLTKGEWHFTFSLDRNKIDIRRLPNTQVMGLYYSEDNEAIQTPIVLTNMKLSNTGLAFQFYRNDSQGRALHLNTSALNLWIVLNSGQEIGARGGSENILTDGISYHNYTWKFPAILDEVVAVKIGEVAIPIE
ncbi:MAG: DUF4179 domain-containing protein [Oscillospiraceae bacterium]|nr:DUF4179 domain-containing protein [Oscillospiraceae bacterium]